MYAMKFSPRFKFLITNGLKGLAWLAILLAVFFLFEEIVISKDPDAWIERFYAKPEIIYLIYFASEFFLGIIPPELFMIWAYNKAGVAHYFMNVAFFAVVSYAMGYITFLIGQFLYKKVAFRYMRRRFLKAQWPLLRKYGLFLIIVAALTPVPWSATSLLVGAAGYPSKKYLLYALSRILRFAVYGYLVFQTHQI
jgi:membrane protein YqaA with SNARE-associated domain